MSQLIRDWLTKTPERGFELPFAQLLISKGHRIIHIDSHSPNEQGKDIVSISPEGEICGYQLKKGTISKSTWRNEVHGELVELVEYPCHHPTVAGELCRPFLVVTGTLSEPAAANLTMFNISLKKRGMANVELLDKGWLEHNLGTGSILTLLSDPELFQKFLDAYYIDGSDYYDQKAYSALSNLLSRRIGEANTANQKIAALLAALVVLQIAGTSYLNHNNHLATAFLCAESAMLISQNCLRYQLPYNALQNSRHLIYDHFEYALNELAREALQSEHMLGVKHDLENSYFDLIIWSESAIPFYFAIYMLLRARPQFTIIGENILLRYFASVSHRLRDESTRSRRFDVYFNVLDALLDPLNSETNSETRYSSQSYTLYPCILLLRRALRRQTLSVFWYDLLGRRYKMTPTLFQPTASSTYNVVAMIL